MDVKAAKTAELVEIYNRLTKKSIKRFATRADAERRTLEAFTMTKTETQPLKPRKVNGMNAGKVGRPVGLFTVELLDGAKMRINSKSIRRQLITWLMDRPGRKANITEIETKFQRDMRGVIRQLVQAGWVKREDIKGAE
jgi:hypothetical protein